MITEVRKIYKDRTDIRGTGHSPKEHNKKITGNHAIIVDVDKIKDDEEVSPDEKMPPEFKRIKTDVVELGARPGPIDDHDFSFIDLEKHRISNPPTEPESSEATYNSLDIGDIAIVEDCPNDSFRLANGHVDFIKAYKKFRNNHPDDYDWVTFFLDFDNTEKNFHCGVFNKTKGINYYKGFNFDNRSSWHTNRLLAIHCISNYPSSLYTILHEMGHQWSAYVYNRYSPNGPDFLDLLKGDSAEGKHHWGKQFDNDYSPMDYDAIDLIDLGDGRFKSQNIKNPGAGDLQYCNLDLYLAGMLPESETDSFWFLDNFNRTGTNITGIRRDISLRNIKWAHGGRMPPYEYAQKHFRQAFILLTRDRNNVGHIVATIEERRQETTWGFFRATNFLGTVDTTLSHHGRLSTIRVRAKGQRVDGVWPQILLKVNGGTVASWKVSNTAYTEYIAHAPLMPARNDIDVVFNNGFYELPQDHTLDVDYIKINYDIIQTESQGVLYDRGYGNNFSDERDIIPGQKQIPWNSALRFWYSPAPVPICIRARVMSTGGVWPRMLLCVNRRIMKSWTEPTRGWTDFIAEVPLRQGNNMIDVVFDNRYYESVNDERNLIIDSIQVGSRTYEAESLDVTYDQGSGAKAFNNRYAVPGNEEMMWSGALRLNHTHFVVPREIFIRARRQQTCDAPPRMFLRVNGCFIREWKVENSTWQEYRASAPFVEEENNIDVVFNAGSSPLVQNCNLHVDWVKVENTIIRADKPGVISDRGYAESSLSGVDMIVSQEEMYWNGALHFKHNLTPSPISIRARSQKTGNDWPHMQLWVNGGLIQTFNVNNTNYIDYDINIPLRPGENRIDIVFNKDNFLPSDNRNLVIDSIQVNGTTIQAEGGGARAAYYDRGTLFDGLDIIPGQEDMTWNGVLRFIYMNPNI